MIHIWEMELWTTEWISTYFSFFCLLLCIKHFLTLKIDNGTTQTTPPTDYQKTDCWNDTWISRFTLWYYTALLHQPMYTSEWSANPSNQNQENTDDKKKNQQNIIWATIPMPTHTPNLKSLSCYFWVECIICRSNIISSGLLFHFIQSISVYRFVLYC